METIDEDGRVGSLKLVDKDLLNVRHAPRAINDNNADFRDMKRHCDGSSDAL